MITRSKKTVVLFAALFGIVLILTMPQILKWRDSTDGQDKIRVEEAMDKKRTKVLNSSTLTFKNPMYGFELSVLNTDTPREQNSEGIYTLTLNDEDKISIMEEGLEGIVRESTGILSETSVTIAGVSGDRVVGGSVKDGSSVVQILLKDRGQLFSFQGSDAFLSRMTKDFRFTN